MTPEAIGEVARCEEGSPRLVDHGQSRPEDAVSKPSSRHVADLHDDLLASAWVVDPEGPPDHAPVAGQGGASGDSPGTMATDGLYPPHIKARKLQRRPATSARPNRSTVT